MIASDYNSFFEKAFKKHTKGMEDHQFRHYNNALGCMIYSKEHYKYELKKRGMIPYEASLQLVSEWESSNKHQDYGELSPKATAVLRSVKMTADKYGNVELGSRAIEALIELGAIKRRHKHMPSGIDGGFS